MRIVLATTEYPSEPGRDGGLAGYVARAAAALADAGHRPVVVTCSDRDGELCDGPVPVHRVDIRVPAAHRALDRMTLRRFAVPIDLLWASRRVRIAVDALHALERVDVCQYPNLGALAWYRPALPVVARLSCHRRWWARADDGLSRGWHGRIQHLMEMRALAGADAVFGPAPAVAAAVAADLRRPVEVIANPFPPPPAIATLVPAAIAGRPFVLVAGGLVPLKGTRVVAAMIAELLTSHPGLVLAWAGSEVGLGAEGARLRAAAGAHAGRVALLGRLPRAELAAAMAAARAVLVPSLVDNLPNTGLEALAAGAVVVATRATGLETLVEDGRSGLLCRPDDAGDLLAACERALALTPTAEANLRAAARAALAPLHPAQALPPLLALYQRAIAAHRLRG